MKKSGIFIAVLAAAICFYKGAGGFAHAGEQTARIKGGQEAQTAAWPWMAALVDADQSDAYGGHFCGGSLIHPRWVLTAAHCVKDLWGLDSDPDEIEVVLGVNDLKDDLEDGKGERIAVKRVISHPDYDPLDEDSDIALVELVEESAYAPISPVSDDSDFEGEDAITMGWGFSDADGDWEYPHELQQVSVPVVSNETCNQAYAQDFEEWEGLWWLQWLFGYESEDQITENMMCAGYSDGDKDACSGDSGGPLLVKDEDVWKVAGIVSWGQACDGEGNYGVYTRVSEFGDFIEEHLSKDYFACADHNGDGEVDREDLYDKVDDFSNAFDDWVKECWRPKADCGDYNDSGRVNWRDRIEKFWDEEQALDDWIQECWIPEL